MSSNADPRALREMVKEAQEGAVPELDWARLESKLFADLEQAPVIEHALEQQALEQALEEHALEEMRPSHVPGAVAAAVDGSTTVVSAALAKATKSTGSPRSAAVGRSVRWLSALAVAAAFMVLWFAHNAPQQSDVSVVSEPVDPMKLPAAPGMNGARDLDALNRGDVVEAALGPVAFGKLGVIEWTLAAGGRLAVRQAIESGSLEAGARVTSRHGVELESGSLRGLVADAAHEFVVVAGETEVATIGAAELSVTRSSQRLVVDLKKGSAAVGQRGQRTGMRVLSAPVRASFSLDGGHSFEIIPDEAVASVVVEPPVADAARLDASDSAARRASSDALKPAVDDSKPTMVAAPVTSSNSGAPVAAVAALPADTSGDSALLSDASVSATLHSCLRAARAKEAASSPGAASADAVKVTIASTLRVQTQADGSVKLASFSPPLRADLQSCAVFLFRSKLAGGARVLNVPVSF